MVKNPHAMQKMQETRVQSLGWEDPLEEEMATHSSIPAWKIPWTEKPSSPSWGCKESYMTVQLGTHVAWNNRYVVIKRKEHVQRLRWVYGKAGTYESDLHKLKCTAPKS